MAGKIDVFIFDAALSDEMSAAQRKRSISAAAHAFVRKHISDAEGVAEDKLQLSYGISGKPFYPGSGVKFNISHCGCTVAAAFSHGEVGVDIEAVRRFNPLVAERFFTEAERNYVGASSEMGERTRRFYRIWTAKEACLKLYGVGIGGGLGFDTASGDGMLKMISTEKYGSAALYSADFHRQNADGETIPFCLSLCSDKIEYVNILHI